MGTEYTSLFIYRPRDLIIPGSDALVGLPAGYRIHSSPEALFDVVLSLQVLNGLQAGTAPRAIQLLASPGQELGRLR